MNNEIKKIKCNGIFTNYIFKAIPLAFDESMSYYETLCGVLALLKTQEKVINNNADALIELENFVTHYFDNLDVQDEINKKLDEMAEDGTLAEIIAQYINLNSIIAFKNVSDLKNATNLINGSLVKTFGFHNVNDGGGAFYVVRQITNEDVVDNMILIALHDNLLVAELIFNDINVKQIGAKGDGVSDDTLAFKKAFSLNKNIIIPKANYLLTDTLDLTNDNIIIKGNFSTLIIDENTDLININANNVIVKDLIINGNNVSRYGIAIDGDFNKIENCVINNALNNGIMIYGSNNLITNVTANSCGWDCVGNYGDASYNNIVDCKAIKCGRHGFSTDPTTHDISFINCYCENIGSPSRIEGHSCYHFEYSDNGKCINCKIVYNNEHPNNQTQCNNPYLGVRVYNSSNVIVDNLQIEYTENYAPLDVTRPFIVENSQDFKMVKANIINDSNNSNVGVFYINCPIELYNCYFKDVSMSDSDAYVAFIRKMVDCYVKNDYHTKFANFALLCENAQFIGNHFIGNNSLSYFLRGRFVNCLFKNNIFETGGTSINLQQDMYNANNRSLNNRIINNIFKNLTSMIHVGVSDGNSNNYVIDNLFTGTCTTVCECEYSWLYWLKNKKYELTYTNLVVTSYFTMFDDLSSQFDYEIFALNPSNAKYRISVDANGNVIGTAI